MKAHAAPPYLEGAPTGGRLFGMALRALIRRPSPRLAEGLVTHIDRRPVDVALAVRQWKGYVEAFRQNGWITQEISPDPDHPDSAFIEDTAVVYRQIGVVARSGAVERRGEEDAVAAALAARGYHLVPIKAPGTIDGGDVLKIGSTILVGQGGRTNASGLAQLAAAFEPLGATVFGVATTKVLHLKSAVTALPDGTVIGYQPLVDDSTTFDRFLAVPDEPGAHVVLLGDDRLLMAADAPRSAELFASLGYRPVCVDISEFEKLEGCVTCLSVRLREQTGIGA